MTRSGLVVQFAIKKPGFFGKAGLLMVELYHHQEWTAVVGADRFG